MADKRLTDLNELTLPVAADEQHIVDKSDLTDSTGGTSKRITLQSIADLFKTLTQVLTNKTLTSPVINTQVTGSAVLDEDDMASDSALKVATQQSIKAYADTKLPKTCLLYTSPSPRD